MRQIKMEFQYKFCLIQSTYKSATLELNNDKVNDQINNIA